MTEKLLFEHIVVLMLENRSFDHLFGFLGKGEGVPAGGITNHLQPGDSTTEAFSTRRGGDFTSVGEGPSHSLKETNLQLYGKTKPTKADIAAGAKLDGFVASFKVALTHDLKRSPVSAELQQVMNCFDPEQLPVLSTLAREFVLCDRWFADVPGPTMPNRAFVHAATSQGYTYNANWKPEFNCKTLYDRINATEGRTWRIYRHDKDEVIELYPWLKKDVGNHVHLAENFAADVNNDQLASYSFIIPAFMKKPQQPVNSMHAPADVRPAEKLVADIYSALRNGPEEVWKKTLLVILFDEHGGYADHVEPPKTVSPDGVPGRTDQPFLVPFDFARLGLRVPAILVSPWFEPSVDSTVYSHATIPGSVIEVFRLKGGFLTKRDKAANKLTQQYLLDDGRRSWRKKVPDLVVPVQPHDIDDMQREILVGAANLDPHPEKRTPLRVDDIQDPAQASHFVSTQIAKHLEHYFALGGKEPKGQEGSMLSTDRVLPSTMMSPARVAQLKRNEADRSKYRP